MIGIDHSKLEMFHLAAKCLTQHDELRDRHNHRNQHERRTPPESAQVAFDDCQNAIHGLRLSSVIHDARIEAGSALQRVTQLMPGEMNKHVIESSALD